MTYDDVGFKIETRGKSVKILSRSDRGKVLFENNSCVVKFAVTSDMIGIIKHKLGSGFL